MERKPADLLHVFKDELVSVPAAPRGAQAARAALVFNRAAGPRPRRWLLGGLPLQGRGRLGGGAVGRQGLNKNRWRSHVAAKVQRSSSDRVSPLGSMGNKGGGV